MSIESKLKIRAAAKSAVRALSITQKASSSKAIFRCVASLDKVRLATTVALFSSLPDEPQTEKIITHLAAERRVVLPRVDGEDMDFYLYAPSSADESGRLASGAFGIAEPQSNVRVAPSEIDVIIVPGVAFTRDGVRCGRGRGYYDKYLSRADFHAFKIGVCYACQIFDEIPAEPHDVRMDEVVAR